MIASNKFVSSGYDVDKNINSAGDDIKESVYSNNMRFIN